MSNKKYPEEDWTKLTFPRPIAEYRIDYSDVEMSAEDQEAFAEMGGEDAFLDYSPDLNREPYADKERNERFLKYRRLYLLNKGEKMDKLHYRLTESEARELNRLGTDINTPYDKDGGVKLAENPEVNAQLVALRRKKNQVLYDIDHFEPLDKLAW